MATNTTNTMLAMGDDRFQKDAAIVRARMVKAYQESLVSVQGQLRTIFVKDTKPAITELRMAQKLKALEGQLAGEIKKLTGAATTLVRNGRNKSLIDAYREAGSSLEMGAGVVLDFSRIVPKEVMDYMASDDLWLKALKTHNTVLHADIRREVEVALRTNARREVITGLSTGKSYKDVANAIQDRFGVATSRAKTITFTEMHKGHNKGRSEGIKQGGKAAKDFNLDVFKVWKHNHVGVPRPEHLAADGIMVPYDKPFRVGGEKLEGPGLGGLAKNNINCHCSMETEIPELETAGALDAEAMDMLANASRAQTYTFTPEGLAKLDPTKLSGQGKAIAEAIHSVEGKKVTVDQVTELVKDTLNSKSGNPRTIVAWYMSDWKKKGLLQILDETGAPKPHIPKVPKAIKPVTVPSSVTKPSTLPSGVRPVSLTTDELMDNKPVKWKYPRKASEGEFVPLSEEDDWIAEVWREHKVFLNPEYETYGIPHKFGTMHVSEVKTAFQVLPDHMYYRFMQDVNAIRKALYDMRSQSDVIDSMFERALKNKNLNRSFNLDISNAKHVVSDYGSKSIGLYTPGKKRIKTSFGYSRPSTNFLHMDQGHHNVDMMDGVGVFRHELGHHIHLGSDILDDYTKDSTQLSWTNIWNMFQGYHGDLANQYETGKAASRPSFHDIVSKYSAKNHKEAFAESFCAFMHPQYGNSDVNTLPREIHNFFVDIFHFRERIP